MLSDEEDLLLQSYFTIAFLAELENNSFLTSKTYNHMHFQDSYIKENLPSIGIGNRGTLVQSLYSMLVLPKELISDRFPAEFNNLNISFGSIITTIETTYSSDYTNVNYIRHLRNSVAHGKISFENNLVIFHDENSRSGEICKIKITLENFGLFMTELQKVFFIFIESLKNKK